ncbi:MAG: phosphoribosylformylglycinamidine synthase, partial [Bacillota bacterium]|nr:phosphoribosylformylglycinamidine synthase [Bacillota bacterium]
LSQRKLCQTASAGYSSYGNQIGLATGLVHEFYHPGYVAKRMEIGAVVGAAPEKNVVRKRPEPGDVVILLGGRTGRDGCGGATGSSKSHSEESILNCGSEVQKGNPPEERKIQRLFRNPEATALIKRCNDFGAGGVSVAVGELADGLVINLDKVPKKYEGLDGTELAISESQERMAVVVSKQDSARFISLAWDENLEATEIASVTEEKRLKMLLNGEKIVDISRGFLDSNGARREAGVRIPPLPEADFSTKTEGGTLARKSQKILSGLNVSLSPGLTERFDGSIGAGSVLMPYGGKTQLTPAQVMAAKLPSLYSETASCSVMSFGFDPYLSEQNPFYGSQAAVVESVARLVASGCDYKEAYLTLQEYFEKMNNDPEKFGKPVSALMGSFEAQLGLSVAAIGGKDSMSGSFDDLSVPPTLVSFAIAPSDAESVISPEFKAPNSCVSLFRAPKNGPDYDYEKLKAMFENVYALASSGRILSAWSLSMGGVIEGIAKMCVGNGIGFSFDDTADAALLFSKDYGSILVETVAPVPGAVPVGRTSASPEIKFSDSVLTLEEVKGALFGTLEGVYPTRAEAKGTALCVSYSERSMAKPLVRTPRPKAVIPVFPGTNCEYDTARAIERAGGEAEILVIRNMSLSMLESSKEALEKAIRSSQMIVLPGGFSGGDEPDGSGKFIAAFFRNAAVKDAVSDLLYNRDGLMLGICNGFQALIKLGLLPFGEIRELDASCPTLTYNLIGRHQSRYVSTRVASVKSPWLLKCEAGDIHKIAVSHGEGRFAASGETLCDLIRNGQIAFQYVDQSGNPSMDIEYNPNGSLFAVEGITSPDGRILGKMGHTERYGAFVAKNIPGEKFQPIFEGGVEYFR